MVVLTEQVSYLTCNREDFIPSARTRAEEPRKEWCTYRLCIIWLGSKTARFLKLTMNRVQRSYFLIKIKITTTKTIKFTICVQITKNDSDSPATSPVWPAPEQPLSTSPPKHSASDVVLARCRNVSPESVSLSLMEGVRWALILMIFSERNFWKGEETSFGCKDNIRRWTWTRNADSSRIFLQITPFLQELC